MIRLWIVSLSLLLAAGSAQAREVSPNEKLLWSCYMICWSLNRDFHGFYDRPLDRPPRDGSSPRLVDLRRATEAGVDALSIDLFITDKYALPAFGDLVKLIHENHLPIQLSPMFDGLADPGLSIDAVAGKIEDWFRRFAQEPCVVRTGGKPVIFTFDATSLKPEQWQSLWQRLHAADCDGYWIAEASHYLSVGESPDFDGARPWLDLFPAANAFNVHSLQRSEDLIRTYRNRYPSEHTWVAPVSMGYWRPEIAVYTSQRGTGLFRDTWKAIADAGVCWVQQSTWNDLSENHHLMPSENRGTTFLELNAYLAKQWKGQIQDSAHPRLYLSQQQEVFTGEDAAWEILALLPPGGVPARASLKLLDAEGGCVHDFPETQFDQPGLQAVQLRQAIHEVPPGRLLFPVATLLDSVGKTHATARGPFTIVTAAGYHPERNFSWLNTSSEKSLPPPACTLHIESPSKSGVIVRVESTGELADVEILRDGCQLVSLRRDFPQVKLVSPVVWEGELRLNRRSMLDWGTYTARAVTTDGRIGTSQPFFIDRPPEADTTLGDWRFDADSETDVLDDSPWLHDGRLGGRPRRKPWFPSHVPDRWGGSCLQFDGTDDRVLLEGAIVPPEAFTVECWIKPAAPSASAGSGQILFATANAAVVLSIDRERHLQASRKSESRWHGVRDRSPLVVDKWQHVAATYDGKALRLYHDGQLAGETPVAGQSKCGQVSIGYNSVTNGSYYSGCLDELRLTSRALSPEEFGPHSPLR